MSFLKYARVRREKRALSKLHCYVIIKVSWNGYKNLSLRLKVCCRLKKENMNSVAEEDKYLQLKLYPHRESANERLQRDLNELRKRVEEYRTQLVHVEEIFQETQVTMKRLQSKAELQYNAAKQDAAREVMLTSELAEMKKELEKLKAVISKPLRKVEEMSESTKTASKHIFASKVLHFAKIGCVLALDSVAAYALFSITKPLVF